MAPFEGGPAVFTMSEPVGDDGGSGMAGSFFEVRNEWVAEGEASPEKRTHRVQPYELRRRGAPMKIVYQKSASGKPPKAPQV